jgi:hypothetical protein
VAAVNEREYVAMSLEVLAKVLRDMPAPAPDPKGIAPHDVEHWLDRLSAFPGQWEGNNPDYSLPERFQTELRNLILSAGADLGVW